MRRRVGVDFTWYFDKAVHAGPKARKDVSRTLSKEGYDVVTLFYPSAKTPKQASWKRTKVLVKLYFKKLIGAKEVLFQYPSMLPVWYLKFLKYQGIRVTLLIHDLDRLRQGHTELSHLERGTFNAVNNLIVHTPAMADYLRAQNVRTPMDVLYLFDYYTDKQEYKKADDCNSIVFCGNLGKSGFLKIFDAKDWAMATYLYGVGAKTHYDNPNVKYKGVFPADDPSEIEGAWGLVWDGPDPETCSTSPIGRYLSYNTSHKISLYLVTGKPVIIWSGCALADWIVKNGLGITVDSLDEIHGRLSDISLSEYNYLQSNIQLYRKKLICGKFLHGLIYTF